MIQPPKYKFKTFNKTTRKFLLAIIRKTTLNFPELPRQLGFDATEEAIIGLIDKGFIKVIEKTINGEEHFALAIYNINKHKYKIIGTDEEVD